MLLEGKNVAIIGAGPVGLTLARLLQLGGVQVSVYERDFDSETRIWGGTLDLHKGSGQDALAAAGLLDKYFERAIPMGVKFADKHGKILATKSLTPEHFNDNPEINRNVLRTLLLDSLEPETVYWDHQLLEAEPKNTKWNLFFNKGKQAKADLVIVANGGMSKLRRYVTDEKVQQTGSFIVQGDIKMPEINFSEFYQICDHHRLMVASGGNLLVVNPLNNEALTYGLIFEMPNAWEQQMPDFSSRNTVIKLLQERLAGWGDLYHQLIAKTTQFVGLPTRVLPLAENWKQHRPLPITLIGDAAHVMPPFAGMGVNIGLLDAKLLAENLLGSKFDSIMAGISGYEASMLEYAREAADESRINELEMRDPAFDFRSLLF